MRLITTTHFACVACKQAFGDPLPEVFREYWRWQTGTKGTIWAKVWEAWLIIGDKAFRFKGHAHFGPYGGLKELV